MMIAGMQQGQRCGGHELSVLNVERGVLVDVEGKSDMLVNLRASRVANTNAWYQGD